MCYLIAKKFEEQGCLAVKTESGKALANLVSYLGLKTLDMGMQILTISDPEAYGEYKPYSFVASEKDFISQVLSINAPTTNAKEKAERPVSMSLS